MRKRSFNQLGIDVVDAIFAMIIASMIAAAVTTSLGTWFSIRTMTASQDGANQYAQGIIAKTSAVSWEKLGFVVPDSTPSPASLTDDGTCPTAFRPSLKVGSTTLNTVTLTGSNPVGLAQTDIATVRGQKYCVMTDVTWNNPADSSATSAKSYGTKNISVKVSWKDKGVPRSITVNSTRSPNIGEAIPAGISQGHDAEVSPLKSFSITRADNDGTNGRICYKGDWATTTDTVSLVGSTSIGLRPATLTNPLSPSDKGVEKCLAVNGSPSYYYYGLQVSDSAGVKFTGVPSYQFPGSKLTATGMTLSWNSYPSTGTTKYNVYTSSTSSFPSTPTATTTDTTYQVNATSPTWVMVETVNSDYSVNAQSNAIQVNPPVSTPMATPAPTATATPTPTPTATATPTANPSIKSGAEIVAFDSSGSLWNYGPLITVDNGRVDIGNGDKTIPTSFFVTDWNGDGIQDLVLQKSNGQLELRTGLPQGGFTTSLIGQFGWDQYDITIGKWKKTDTLPSIIAIEKSTGDLYLYANTNGAAPTSRTKFNTGWAGLIINLLDYDKDGNMDVIAKFPNGELHLYRTDGNGSFIPEARAVINTGWNIMDSIHVISGAEGAGTRGIVARVASSGDLYYYPIGTSSFGSGRKFNFGWTGYRIAGN